MGISYNTSTVRDGLVLHLDAANKKSYPGTGTVWKDLSGNNYNGTLINGVGYNSANKGSMIFDGVNDYAQSTVTNDISGNQPWTISAWANINSSANGSGRNGWLIWHGTLGQTTNQLISMGVTSGAIEIAHWGNDNVFSEATIIFNNWAMYTCSFDGTTERVYVNDVLKGIRNTQLNVLPGDWYIAAAAGLYLLNCSVSNVSIYNRALTSTKIKQNFEALHGRYGI